MYLGHGRLQNIRDDIKICSQNIGGICMQGLRGFYIGSCHVSVNYNVCRSWKKNRLEYVCRDKIGTIP